MPDRGADDAGGSGPRRPPGPMVVGIGASAGGLAALRTLLGSMPGDTGLAFVIVVHLAPDHESHLADLLQSSCSMPIEQVTENVALEPDHVYVIPPGRNLDSIDSHLRPSDLEDRAHQRAPIDHFFRTLSRTHDSRAVGVVLTGTGSDGTTGLEYIKDRGGLTIVQDPEEAEFDGMPRSAITSGFVDEVLPISAMPARILGFARTDPKLVIPADGGNLPDEAEHTLQRILSQIRARTGHDMTGYKRATVLRRLKRRMQLHQCERMDGYLALLRDDPDEARRLFDDLLISVTGFFRDTAVFDHVEQDVLPDLLVGKGPADTVRVWSVGCATGEEAYSLAMLLIEATDTIQRPPKVQVFATDLHDVALQRARDGFYPELIHADVSPARLQRFFTKHADGYRVNKDVRDIVVFAPHSLLRDPPFSHLDLVSCRNLLIYLQRDIQRRVIDLFHYALDPGGYLLLGTSETVDRSELFAVANKGFCVFRRRDVVPPAPTLPVFASSPRPAGRGNPDIGPPLVSGGPSGFGHIHQQVVERYAPPSVLVNDEQQVLHFSANAGDFLVHPGGAPTHDLIRLVRDELRIELRAALYAAREQGAAATSRPVSVPLGGRPHDVVIRVRAVSDDGGRGLYLVIFDDVGEHEPGGSADPTGATTQGLENELDLTKQRLQSLIDEYETSQEEMRASNEEMQSTNEELRSTLEELETSKEELQSVNEELVTLNQENRHKVEELRLLSSDLQNLLISTDIATLFLDRQLRILRFTPRIGELFNVRNTDRGRPLTDLTHQLGDSGIHDDARGVLEHLVPVEREIRSEDERWFLTRVLPYRTTDDHIEGVVITFVDITRRREAEFALRESEARMRVALDASRMGAWTWQPTTDTFTADSRTVELLGLGNGDSLGVDEVVGHVVGQDRAGLRAALDASVAGDGPRSAEVRAERDGVVRWLLVTGQGYRDDGPDGSTIRVAGTVLDITERKETETQLERRVAEQTEVVRQSERRFRALVEASSQIVWSTDPAGQMVDDSEAWRAFTGQSFEEMRGRGWLDAVHDDDRRSAEAAWADALQNRRPLEIELRLRHQPTEQWRWVLMRKVPVPTPEETLAGWIGTVTDIDERKRADEQIRTLASTLTMAEHEERRRIAHFLHDDIQQRLYSIQMKVGLLRDSAVDDEQAAALAEVHGLLADSVDLTHNLTVDLSPPVLEGEGLTDALGWLATQMESMHGLHVDVVADQSFPIADDDMRVFLFQIVRELLFNVVKHADVDRARVDLGIEDDQLRIVVSDEGRGFDTRRAGRAQPGGLGLSSATERLALFGGAMHIGSDEGSGTTVTVIIPVGAGAR